MPPAGSQDTNWGCHEDATMAEGTELGRMGQGKSFRWELEAGLQGAWLGFFTGAQIGAKTP